MSNLQIRAFEMADWEDLATLFQAPKCQRGTLQLPYQSRDDLKRKFSVGTPVVVEGLQSHDHFNGKRGEIVEVPSHSVGAAEPRWGVKLIEDGEGRQKGSKKIRVKHSNLRDLDDLKTKF